MKQRGFTYLELLIALTFFSVAVLGVLRVFPINRRFLAQSANATVAATLAQEEIEFIHSLPYASVPNGVYEATHTVGTNPGDSFDQFSRHTEVHFIDGTWNTSATDVGLKRIDVKVTWTENNANRTYVLTSYVKQ